MMDKSKEYIRMCKEAWKYLEREVRMNDIVAYRYIFDGYISENVAYFSYIAEKWMIREKNESEVEFDYIFIIWKQDQLQAMTGAISILCLLDDFHKFLDSDYCDAKCPGFYFDSIEQLWLGFLMKERYNKIWDDREWI